MALEIKNKTFVTIKKCSYSIDNGALVPVLDFPDFLTNPSKSVIHILTDPKINLFIEVELDKKDYANSSINDGGLKFTLDKDDFTDEILKDWPDMSKYKTIDSLEIIQVQTNTKEKHPLNHRVYRLFLRKTVAIVPKSLAFGHTHIDIDIEHPDT